MLGVLDLFCGCGGMSWGLKKGGLSILCGIDNWKPALNTFALNEPDASAVEADISQVNPLNVLVKAGIGREQVDIIVGGPPCQGFSKNTPASERFLEDPRNQMYKAFLGFVRAICPKAVVIENVAEIYNAYGGTVRNEILSVLASLGYQTEVKVVDMSKYGIPQKRRRCIFLASRIRMPKFPAESRPVSAWDAISDLPAVEQGEGYDGMPYGSEPLNEYQKHMRLHSDSVWNHCGHVLSEVQTARIASLKPGQGLKDLPESLKVKGGYSGAYGRLDYASPAPTITRWCFHIGSGRFSHPRETRSITMREAARLQSFSDDFHFTGTLQEQAGQIGNAVPPLFMERLAECIKTAVE